MADLISGLSVMAEAQRIGGPTGAALTKIQRSIDTIVQRLRSESQPPNVNNTLGFYIDGRWIRNLQITPEDLLFGLISSIEVQPIVQANVALNSVAATTVLTVPPGTEGGFLQVGIEVIGTPAGNPVVVLEYEIDGSAPSSLTLYSGGGAFFADEARVMSINSSGTGGVIGDFVTFIEGLAFTDSLVVRADVTTAGASGSIRVYVKYGVAT